MSCASLLFISREVSAWRKNHERMEKVNGRTTDRNNLTSLLDPLCAHRVNDEDNLVHVHEGKCDPQSFMVACIECWITFAPLPTQLRVGLAIVCLWDSNLFLVRTLCDHRKWLVRKGFRGAV